MDIAIVTGAETPLGLRLAQSLIQQGCRVHGIGNNFSKVDYADSQFMGHAVDLTDSSAVSGLLQSILDEEKRLDVLIHAIDVTPGAAFEKLPVGNLEAVLKIGLLGPVMMTRLALPNLIRFRGQLINVLTSNKNGHSASAVNALIEGGLREMNRALFDQSRDAGLRVTNCILRQNTTLPGAQVDDDVLEQTHIDLEDVARTIEQLIDPKVVNVPSEVVLYPRLSAEAEQALPESPLPVDDYSAVTLPPKEYCPPEQPKIKTAEKQNIERSIPYTDEEMEDKIAAAIEDFEAHPERYERPEPTPQKQQQQGGAGGNQQDGGQGKSKRRRRRGGRNRNRNRDSGEPTGGGQGADNAPNKSSDSNRDRSDRRDSNQGGKDSKDGNTQRQPKTPPESKKTERVESASGKKTDAKPVKKKAAKKSPAKKAAKKAAKKTAKKAAKKVAKKAAKKAPRKISSQGTKE